MKKVIFFLLLISLAVSAKSVYGSDAIVFIQDGQIAALDLNTNTVYTDLEEVGPTPNQVYSYKKYVFIVNSGEWGANTNLQYFPASALWDYIDTQNLAAFQANVSKVMLSANGNGWEAAGINDSLVAITATQLGKIDIVNYRTGVLVNSIDIEADGNPQGIANINNKLVVAMADWSDPNLGQGHSAVIYDPNDWNNYSEIEAHINVVDIIPVQNGKYLINSWGTWFGDDNYGSIRLVDELGNLEYTWLLPDDSKAELIIPLDENNIYMRGYDVNFAPVFGTINLTTHNYTPVTTGYLTTNITGILNDGTLFGIADDNTNFYDDEGNVIGSTNTTIGIYNTVLTKPEPSENPLYTIGLSTSDGAGGSYGLMLGIDPAGTDGIDSELGETELPPLPPSGVYDARLILPDGTTGSPADYRGGDANFTGQVEYEVNWQLGEGTVFTLEVDVPEVPGTVTVTVYDLVVGTIVNEVINEGGGQVVVNNDAISALGITVDYNAPIPVELSSFAANVVGETIRLVWETATETNNKGFVVERSEDNAKFTKVGYIDGNGTTSEKQSYTFTDHHAVSGTYYYRLRQVDFDGTSSYSDAVEVDFVPTEYSLGQNYPNPFNPSTRIKFAVPVDSKVTVTLYNMLGQKVQEIVSQNYSVGLHEVDFNASELSSGMYIYSITALGVDGSNFVDTKKMMLMK
ncbi:MAG: hypothetical protein SCALA702_10640 [Melioribacteraceae bacterium]|nr:MAG: hypothetical protein SCALA702_10640 [Melioribacteraceae bacterium]